MCPVHCQPNERFPRLPCPLTHMMCVCACMRACVSTQCCCRHESGPRELTCRGHKGPAPRNKRLVFSSVWGWRANTRSCVTCAGRAQLVATGGVAGRDRPRDGLCVWGGGGLEFRRQWVPGATPADDCHHTRIHFAKRGQCHHHFPQIEASQLRSVRLEATPCRKGRYRQT